MHISHQVSHLKLLGVYADQFVGKGWCNALYVFTPCFPYVCDHLPYICSQGHTLCGETELRYRFVTAAYMNHLKTVGRSQKQQDDD
jgi:hypothetical protein